MEKSSLLSRVLKSVFFRSAGGRAYRTAKNSRSILKLVQDALQKSGGLSGANAGLRAQLSLLTRLLKAYASGEYREIPWKTLLRMLAVLIYFVSPLDFIPDLLPVIGLTDDIALLVWLFSSVKDDLEKFAQWESRKDIIPIG
ncbi:YkvA family protein [Rudanella lutea]|uniref:YkvA family protein n=1 Tax=Rudanella lutea TaxID=451374 RepID=UPI00036421A5|nr:YkvA family protein [Rudanella lutea]